MRSRRCVTWVLALFALGIGASIAATNWTQFGFDLSHSGFNDAENGYSTSGGNRLLYSYNLPRSADSAPIYLAGVATGSGTKNLLFVVTNDGSLYALDADSTSLAVVWSHPCVAPPEPAFNYCTKLTTGSPVVDPDGQFVYAYALDGEVHKYQVGDGTEITSGGWPQVSSLKTDVEKGASGLSIAVTPNGTFLYSVTDGYIGDGGDYQGHVTAINLATGAQQVFNSECSNLTIHFVENGTTSGPNQDDCASHQNGIWGRPGAIYDAGSNRVFITTGNGPFNPGSLNWGDSVLALNPDGTGSGNGLPLDSYTPSTFQHLQNTDADLGSNSLALVPAPAASSYRHLGVIAGKDDCVRLIRLDNLSNSVSPGPGYTGGSLQSQPLDENVSSTNCDDTNSDGGNDAGGNGEIRAQPAVWVNPADDTTWVYISNVGSTLAAYKVVINAGLPSLAQQWTASAGTSPVIANGTLYYLAGSKLVALNAVSGNLVWQSGTMGSIHWQSPILVNGRLYAIDSTSKLWVYQLDGAFENGFE